MKAREILLGCARDGVSLSVADDGLIRYSGNKYAVAYWLPILAENKASVIVAISRNGQPAVVRGRLRSSFPPAISQRCRSGRIATSGRTTTGARAKPSPAVRRVSMPLPDGNPKERCA